MAERFGELLEAEIQVLLGKALQNPLRRGQIMNGN